MLLNKALFFFLSILLLGAHQALAEGHIGVSYFSGKTTTPTVTQFEDISLDGWGVSLGLGLTESLSWSIYRNTQEGAEVVEDRIGAIRLRSNSIVDSGSWGSGLSYFGDIFWVSLRYSRTETDTQLIDPMLGRGDVILGSRIAVNFLESQTSQSLGLEIGKDWLFGQWSPSISLGFNTQESEISRRELLGRVNFTQIQLVDESLSGTDISLSASLLYYFQFENQLTLAPAIGIFHQSQISGDISGTSQFGLRTTSGSRRQSSSYQENLSSSSQTALDAGLNLLIGDWVINGTYITDLDSESAGDSVLLGVSYSF